MNNKKDEEKWKREVKRVKKEMQETDHENTRVNRISVNRGRGTYFKRWRRSNWKKKEKETDTGVIKMIYILTYVGGNILEAM